METQISCHLALFLLTSCVSSLQNSGTFVSIPNDDRESSDEAQETSLAHAPYQPVVLEQL